MCIINIFYESENIIIIHFFQTSIIINSLYKNSIFYAVWYLDSDR